MAPIQFIGAGDEFSRCQTRSDQVGAASCLELRLNGHALEKGISDTLIARFGKFQEQVFLWPARLYLSVTARTSASVVNDISCCLDGHLTDPPNLPHATRLLSF